MHGTIANTESERIIHARKKRNSCSHFRRDFGRRIFPKPVCSKRGYVIPSLMICLGCGEHSDCDSSKPFSRQLVTSNAPARSIRGEILHNSYRSWASTQPMVTKTCVVCGAGFLTRNPAQDRCNGICANNLKRFMDNESGAQKATGDYIREMLETRAVN